MITMIPAIPERVDDVRIPRAVDFSMKEGVLSIPSSDEKRKTESF